MEKPAALPRRALRRHCFHRWRAGRRCSSPTVPRPPDRSWLSPPGPEVVGAGRRGRSRCAAAYCAGKLNKLALGDRFRGHLIAADSVEEATVESGSSSASGSPTAVGPCPRWVRSSTISGQVVAPTCRSLWCHNRARAAANNRYSITSSVLPSYLRRRPRQALLAPVLRRVAIEPSSFYQGRSGLFFPRWLRCPGRDLSDRRRLRD